MDFVNITAVLGNLGEFVGAIAVVATLAYLTVQVRQNTRQLRRLEMNAGMAQFSTPRMALVTDRSLAQIVVSADRHGETLDEADQLRFDMLMTEHAWAFFHNWDRYETGTVDRLVWEMATRPGLMVFLEMPGVSSWWNASCNQFPESFRQEVGNVLLEAAPSAAGTATRTA